MRYLYPAVFVEEDEGGYSIFFRDFDIATQGEDMKDGVRMASEALWLIIDDYLEFGRPLPEPVFEEPDEGMLVVITVEVDPDEPLLSTKEAACMLGVSSARVRQMIRTGQLDWKKRGRDNYIYMHSVKERLAAAPKAGRPKKDKAVPAEA